MKKLFQIGNAYAAQSNWGDFALVKLCMASLGVFAGTFVPEKCQKKARLTAGVTFSLTWAVLMTKLVLVVTRECKK